MKRLEVGSKSKQYTSFLRETIVLCGNTSLPVNVHLRFSE